MNTFYTNCQGPSSASAHAGWARDAPATQQTSRRRSRRSESCKSVMSVMVNWARSSRVLFRSIDFTLVESTFSADANGSIQAWQESARSARCSHTMPPGLLSQAHSRQATSSLTAGSPRRRLHALRRDQGRGSASKTQLCQAQALQQAEPD